MEAMVGVVMPAINHVHTYVKYKSRPRFYRCDAPNCTHFLDKDALVGKLSLCTECGAQMILTSEDLKRVRPRCINCSDTVKARAHRKAQELTRYIGTEAFIPLTGIQITPPSDFEEDEEGEELDE